MILYVCRTLERETIVTSIHSKICIDHIFCAFVLSQDQSSLDAQNVESSDIYKAQSGMFEIK